MTSPEVRAAIRSSLHRFLIKAFPSLVRNKPFKDNWHLEAIAHYLTPCMTGECKRLIITLPPRHLKSILTSVCFPAFVLGKYPAKRFICASYSQDLAETFSVNTRDLMMEPWYQEVFPAARLSTDQNRKSEFVTTEKGGRLATSVGGMFTGRGGDFIIIDDPHKASDVYSDTARQAVIDWYKITVSTRLDDPTEGVIILVQQRLHVDDLAGYLLESNTRQDQERTPYNTWTHLNLPAIAERDEAIAMGRKDPYERKTGDILHPEHLPLENLIDLKENILGPIQFAAQYQQDPAPLDGIFHFSSFRRFLPSEQPANGKIVQSWDTASGTKDHNAYSVCTTWRWRSNSYFLLHILRKRLNYPALKKTVIDHAREMGAGIVLIENKGSGIELLQEFRQERQAFDAIGQDPTTSKVERAVRCLPKIESGKVFLPEKAPFLEEFERECRRFPSAPNDQVDSLSQFLIWASEQDNQLAEGKFHMDRMKEAIDKELKPGNLDSVESLKKFLQDLGLWR